MPRLKMTKAWADAVTVDQRTDFDDEIVRNLQLRVSPSDGDKPPRRIWNCRYFRDSDGGRQRVKIGAYPALSVEKAREKALKLAVAVIDGKDPASAKKAGREAMTVAELGALYIEKHAKPNKRTWAEDERLLEGRGLSGDRPHEGVGGETPRPARHRRGQGRGRPRPAGRAAARDRPQDVQLGGGFRLPSGVAGGRHEAARQGRAPRPRAVAGRAAHDLDRPALGRPVAGSRRYPAAGFPHRPASPAKSAA